MLSKHYTTTKPVVNPANIARDRERALANIGYWVVLVDGGNHGFDNQVVMDVTSYCRFEVAARYLTAEEVTLDILGEQSVHQLISYISQRRNVTDLMVIVDTPVHRYCGKVVQINCTGTRNSFSQASLKTMGLLDWLNGFPLVAAKPAWEAVSMDVFNGSTRVEQVPFNYKVFQEQNTGTGTEVAKSTLLYNNDAGKYTLYDYVTNLLYYAVDRSLAAAFCASTSNYADSLQQALQVAPYAPFPKVYPVLTTGSDRFTANEFSYSFNTIKLAEALTVPAGQPPLGGLCELYLVDPPSTIPKTALTFDDQPVFDAVKPLLAANGIHLELQLNIPYLQSGTANTSSARHGWLPISGLDQQPASANQRKPLSLIVRWLKQ